MSNTTNTQITIHSLHPVNIVPVTQRNQSIFPGGITGGRMAFHDAIHDPLLEAGSS